jgi:hypothetical protein
MSINMSMQAIEEYGRQTFSKSGIAESEVSRMISLFFAQ